jgi:peptide/nickel transport system permease protein
LDVVIAMAAYIVRRLMQAVIVLFIVSLIVFSFLHIMPGDPVLFMLGTTAPSQEVIDALRKELWLDRPLVVQYGHWLSNCIQGDFGKSILYNEEVTSILARRVPITIHIGLLSFILANLLGVLAGIICAVRRGKILDSVISTIANIGLAIPSFWLGILGIYLFSLKLGLLPVQGYTSPFSDFWLNTRQLIMPVFCLAIVSVAAIARQTRSAMLEVIRQDYIRTAWAKGFTERKIIIKHVLKNGLIPVATLSGMQLGVLIGGTVLIETVFNIPGMGRLIASSVMSRDYIVVQACALVIGVSVVLINLAVDIFYGWLDPRIRYD